MRIIPENRAARAACASDYPGAESLILVTGGAASGKSDYAEDLAVRLHAKSVSGGENTGKPHLWYVATMHHDHGDEETNRRIEKHRNHRAGREFETIEQERCIGRLMDVVHPGDTVLLEDLSNLLANELFPWDAGESGAEDLKRDSQETDSAQFRSVLKEGIIDPILGMCRSGVRFVAVGNRITEDIPRLRDEGTENYIAGFQYILRELGAAAGHVVEVVCGIPIE